MPEDNKGTATTTDTREVPVERQRMIYHRRSPIHVLHVDDAPQLVETGRQRLEQYDDRIEVDSARSAAEGLNRLADEPVDCLISDYSMPGTNGVEFLQTVREEWPTLPFILYTSSQSEAVITEALSSGVTDYMQKQGGTAHLEVLGQKIVTTVEARRLSQTQKQLLSGIEAINVGVGILNKQGRVVYANDSLVEYLETDEQTLRGTHLERLYENIPPTHRERLADVAKTGLQATTLRVEGDQTMETHVLASTATDGMATQTPGTKQNSAEISDDDGR
ncbi:MAG: response regulator [Halobacteriales archaeon]